MAEVKERIDALKSFIDAVYEWVSKFPLKGAASKEDEEASTMIYAYCEGASDNLDEVRQWVASHAPATAGTCKHCGRTENAFTHNAESPFSHKFEVADSPAPSVPRADKKRPINRPCSACSDGDSQMEYHDHEPPYADEAAPATGKERCPKCNSAYKGHLNSACIGGVGSEAHEWHRPTAQSGASAPQGAREVATKQEFCFVQNGMVDINGRYLDGLDICQFAEDYAASLRSEVERLKAELADPKRLQIRTDKGEVWYWQGDGYDFPESLGCPVIMQADEVRRLLALERTVSELRAQLAERRAREAVALKTDEVKP